MTRHKFTDLGGDTLDNVVQILKILAYVKDLFRDKESDESEAKTIHSNGPSKYEHTREDTSHADVLHADIATGISRESSTHESVDRIVAESPAGYSTDDKVDIAHKLIGDFLDLTMSVLGKTLASMSFQLAVIECMSNEELLLFEDRLSVLHKHDLAETLLSPDDASSFNVDRISALRAEYKSTMNQILKAVTAQRRMRKIP